MRRNKLHRNLILIIFILTIVVLSAIISGCSCVCGDRNGNNESETPSAELVEPNATDNEQYVIVDITEDEPAEETTATTTASQDTPTENEPEGTGDATSEDLEWTPPIPFD